MITGPTASLVIPAHNEQQTIARLLGQLLDPAAPGEFEIVVVCNGCTDDTAIIARRFGPEVSVVEIPEPSKAAALRVGDGTASHFPRIYVDADVEIAAADIRHLITALTADGAQAAGPVRVVPKHLASPLVRAYYEVWERLPQVQTGLFGRGVIALSRDAHTRVAALPEAMSDDLAISEAFRPGERAVVATAKVVVRPPRTIRDLMRRRIRVHTGNAQFDATTGRADEAKTSPADLVAIVRARPTLAPAVAVFAAVAVAAKLAARRQIRRGDYSTWLRDDSSRAD